MPNTDSVDRLLDTVREALLTFVPLAHPLGGTATLAERLGTATGSGSDAKLYIEQPPDPVTYPWGLMHLLGSRTQGDDSRFQKRFLLEINYFGFPRDHAVDIAAMADITEAFWRDYRSLAVDDAIVSQGIDSRDVIVFTDPANREIARERLVMPFYATPYYLAQYSSLPTL